MVGRQELQAFHSTAYLAFLHSHNEQEEEEEEEEEGYGLGRVVTAVISKYSTHALPLSHNTGYDCPIFPGLFEYVCTMAGSSLAAADSLVRKEADVAVNWYGGWHHASKLVSSLFSRPPPQLVSLASVYYYTGVEVCLFETTSGSNHPITENWG